MKKILSIMITLLMFTTLVAADTFRLGEERYSFSPSNIVTKTSAYTLTSSDSLVKVSSSTANITITLPTVASTRPGTKAYKIQKTDTTNWRVIVTPATGDTIGGESTRYLTGYNDYIVISTGSGDDWTISYESPYTNEDYEAGTIDVDATTRFGSVSYTLDTTSQTLTHGDCGEIHAIATDAKIYTLPVTRAGCVFTFVNAGAAGNNIITIDPNDADQIFGTITTSATNIAIVGSAGDSLVNTKATAIRGDAVTIVGDGTDGWYILNSTGIWADGN